MRYLIRLLKFFQGFKLVNRCPNCEVSFSKNGEGGLETVVNEVDGKELFSEEISICIKCLESPTLLDKDQIKIGLQRRGFEEDDIKDSLDAVDKYLQGEISYAPWCKPPA
jgi:uncharacterized protein with PIN domain